MYTSFFGLVKKPFSLTPDPEFLYLSPNHKKALTVLKYGLMSQAGFTVITGAIGAGKTTLVRHILNTIDEESIAGLISNTHTAFGDLLTWVLSAFNIEHDARNKAERYQKFVEFIQMEWAKQRRVILIVDEAQNMELQTLEELRLLSNINVGQDAVLQIVLVGQPELLTKLQAPELIQFAQRVSVGFNLSPLNFQETKKYIYYRLLIAGGSTQLFTPSACSAIYYFTTGVPRIINNICDLSLLFAFAEDEKIVSLQTVIEVIKEKKIGGITPLDGRKGKAYEEIRKNILANDKIDLELI
ncbi:MAG: AAA family ATPase [Methylococcaceae bacterium]|nr:AAA family ATPase [Methylococcaceae bacterium]